VDRRPGRAVEAKRPAQRRQELHLAVAVAAAQRCRRGIDLRGRRRAGVAGQRHGIDRRLERLGDEGTLLGGRLAQIISRALASSWAVAAPPPVTASTIAAAPCAPVAAAPPAAPISAANPDCAAAPPLPASSPTLSSIFLSPGLAATAGFFASASFTPAMPPMAR
jgi:hypothetical protein